MIQGIFKILLSIFLILGIFTDSAFFSLCNSTIEYTLSFVNSSDDGRTFALFLSENVPSEEESSESDEDNLDEDLEDSSKLQHLRIGSNVNSALIGTLHQQSNHLRHSPIIKRHIVYHHLKIYC